MLPNTESKPQTPEAINTTALPERLSQGEQFLLGIISGCLTAIGFAPLKWLLVLVVIPFILLEVWELVQLTVYKADIRYWRHMKRLRIQQFGHGLICGSGVATLVGDSLTELNVITAIHLLLFTGLSMSWTLYWTFPTWEEFQRSILKAANKQPETLPFFEPKSSQLLQQKKIPIRRAKSFPRKIRSINRVQLQLPMGQAADTFALPAPKRQRLSRTISSAA